MIRLRLLALLRLLTASAFAVNDVNLCGDNQTFNLGTAERGELTSVLTLTIHNNCGASFDWYAGYSPTFASNAPDWNAGTSYSPSNQLIWVVYNNHFWQAIANSTGMTPGTDGTKWFDGGLATVNTIQMDGDARASVFTMNAAGDCLNATTGSTVLLNNTGGQADSFRYWTMTSGATCTLDVYLTPSLPNAGGSPTAVSGHIYLVDHNGTTKTTITLNGTGTAVPQTGPTLPTGINASDLSGEVVDTTLNLPSSCTGAVISDAATLTSRLASASCGDRLCLAHGVPFRETFRCRRSPVRSTPGF